MKGKHTRFNVMLTYMLLSVLATYTICTLFVNKYLFYIGLVLTMAAAIVVVVSHVWAQSAFKRYLSRVAEQLSREDRLSLSHFPLPVLVGDADGTVLWYNEPFREQVLEGEEVYGRTLSEMTGGYAHETICKKKTLDVAYARKKYNVYISTVSKEDDVELMLLYYVDNTRLKEIAEEFSASRPVVLSVFIDNLEEFSADVRDSARAQLAGAVENLLEEWIGNTGLLRKYDSDRFVIVTEKRYLEEMVRERFKILDKVRAMPSGVHNPITLSIGVGQGSNVATASNMAAQALEMALGRGGDQAAVKTKNGFDFYGGVSKGVERRTKVRTRMVASALNELIHNSSKVLVMGHTFSDMDSIGSAAAIALMVRKRGKTAYVVVDQAQSLAKEMIGYLQQTDADLFIDPQDAELLLDADTLLIITDTHHPERVESPKLLSKAKMTAVIDHHRRMIDAIENAVLFYHEPSASSASEMVAELLQYMGEPAPDKPEAEALLAGIILDTRNFVLKAGARTFEAAAYLRRLGADTVQVQSLFSASMELYRKKSALVSTASVYKEMAISCGEGNGGDSRIAASQAANELLTIRGVKAAFTLIKTDHGVNLSARSMGEVNVQLLMEALGGGGHLTMAGAFIKGVDTDGAVAQLKTAIDEYLQRK